VVSYAANRRVEGGNADYWDHATRLELAVLAKDATGASAGALADAVASIREVWEPETTARNLRLSGSSARRGSDAAKVCCGRGRSKKPSTPKYKTHDDKTHDAAPRLRAFLSFYEVVSVFCSISLRRVPRSLLSFSYSPTLFNSASEMPLSRSETSPTFISSYPSIGKTAVSVFWV
jgi:hypothetical protein